MSDITAHVNKVMNSAVKHLEDNAIAVTPSNQYHTILGWYLAWQTVADDIVAESELLKALEIAHDRLYCKLINIQY